MNGRMINEIIGIVGEISFVCKLSSLYDKIVELNHSHFSIPIFNERDWNEM